MPALHDQSVLPRYGDLAFDLDPSRLAELGAALEAAAQESMWEHSVDHEHDKRLGLHNSDWIVFAHCDDPGALLFLVDGSNRVYVSNIVPTERSRLTEEEYNALLESFADAVARPAAKHLGVSVTVDTDPYDLAAELGQRVYALLTTSWAVSNSMMSDRFRTFVIAVAELAEGKRPAPSRIREWLEANGWDPETASEWAITYEQGLALLDQTRRAG